MIAVMFELEVFAGREADYFETAEALGPLLEGVVGFISVERFESRSKPGQFLSLSFWESEAALEHWRKQETHREAQAQGRGGVFKFYRLRVAQVLRDYGLANRAEVPVDSLAYHDKLLD